MREDESHLHDENERIERAQPQRAFEWTDRLVRLPEKDFDKAFETPGGSEIRIERERPIDQRHAVIELADDEGQRKPGLGERIGVVGANPRRHSC